ncbi:MAG: hypothetical protein RLY20_2997 [Verrucomicrobiota bacterium]|jgi:hypothetical protein
MARVIQVGSDKVILDGHRILIDAKHPILDWSVREFCHHPIYFEGWRYLLVGKRRIAKPFAIRYELHSWPEDLHESSSISFTYDEAFVAARDAQLHQEQRHEALWFLLLPLYPLLGLCWSRFKERVLWPIGFVPTSITSASVLFVFVLLVVEAVFYGWLQGGLFLILTRRSFDWWIIHDWVDLLLMFALGWDCSVRFRQLFLEDTPVPDGLFEWIWPKRHNADRPTASSPLQGHAHQTDDNFVRERANSQ